MSDLTIVCDNCGAKYRLPASFSGDKAKCKQCSSVIDVAAQKAASAAPKPTAPSKPAVAAARTERPAARAEQAESGSARPRRAERTKKDTELAPAAGRRGRGERAEQPKKNNTMLLAGGGIGALAVIAVIAVLSMGGNDEPTATPQANAAAATEPPPAAVTPAAPATTEPAATAAQPAVDASDKAGQAEAQKQPREAAASPSTEKQAAEAPAKPDALPAGPKWMRNKTQALADVFDPKALGELTWPTEITEETKTEVRGLVQDVVDGGKAGISAKVKLAKLEYPAIFGIVERLRQLDYKSDSEQMTAWEFNKLLDGIFLGLNADFEAVEHGEALDPRKADHNARTNIAWGGQVAKYPTSESFAVWRKSRLEKGDKK